MLARWWRLSWAMAFFALAGTPAVRTFCAASCDWRAAHAGHAAPSVAPSQDAGHAHAAHHAAALDDSRGPGDARLTAPDPRSCEDLTAVAVSGPRGGPATAPPVTAVAAAFAGPPAPHLHAPPPIRARPPGGAAAPLPLRI
jgi:hypothetical protein